MTYELKPSEQDLENKVDTDFTKHYKEALIAGSYFATITVRDKTKEENDLMHHVLRRDFSLDDVLPSLDNCVRQLGVKPVAIPEVIKPPKVYEKRRPLKIAIITHFNKCPDSFSPGKACKNLIKILIANGHQPVFFTMEGSKLDVGCEMRSVVTQFRREKNIINEEAKNKFIDVLREQLTTDFDLAISFDLFIDDCITYREAIKECGVPIEWLHYARSGIGQPIDFAMPNARYVYLNYADAGIFANKIGVQVDQVRTIFNEKDPAFFFRWHPITKMIAERFQLWDRDIIQIYPVCSTRLDAKGLDSIIQTFSALKGLGKKVALIVCNSNGRKRVDDLKRRQELAKELGLNENEFIFTSLLADEVYDTASEVPNQVVSELFQISNLFIFPTHAENGPNIVLEASMTKNLVVINSDLPLMYDFVDRTAVLEYPFTSNRSMHFTGRDNESVTKLAKQIVGQIESNKIDKQFRRVWRKHNAYTIYHEMLEPVLFERIKETNEILPDKIS